MDRDRRLRIASLFEEAMDLPPEEQARFLERECGTDVELRREVQKLLDADGAKPRPQPAEHTTERARPTAPQDASTSDTQIVSHADAVTLDMEPRQCAITIGSLVGRYRVVEQLGEGGMGAVFLARHEDLGQDAVVKVLLHRTMASSADSVQRFLREARMAAAIRHPGVVQVMDFGRHEGGDLFILMERLYGESLQRRLQRAGKLPPRTAISFALQTARALAAVHAHGVHRDLKPDNLFLVPDPEVSGGERVKILDFGIAKLRSQPGELTHSGVAMGTPPYMSPEQCLEAAAVDGRADLYSLGVLMFQMLSGQLPFRCLSFGEYIIAHTQRRPPPVCRFARVSRGLCDLVARLLAKRPEDRFDSSRELVAALEGLPEIQSMEAVSPRSHTRNMRTELRRYADSASDLGQHGLDHAHAPDPSIAHVHNEDLDPHGLDHAHTPDPSVAHAHVEPEAAETACTSLGGHAQPEPPDDPQATAAGGGAPAGQWAVAGSAALEARDRTERPHTGKYGRATP